jgi:hypothetical protein
VHDDERQVGVTVSQRRGDPDGRRDDQGSGPSPSPSRIELAIPARAAELPALRAAVAEWLLSGPVRLGSTDGAVLTASEMAHLAIDHCDAGHPVIVRMRRTHSIVVIEVTFRHRGDTRKVESELGLSSTLMEIQLMDHFSDRLDAEAGGGTVTLRSTFYQVA